VPPKHECRWRTGAEKLTRELEAERAARQVAEAKLASALTQIAEYEKRLFGRTTERVVPVDRELRDAEAVIEVDRSSGDRNAKTVLITSSRSDLGVLRYA